MSDLTSLDGYGRDLTPWHEIEDQVERGPRELNAQEAEWWGDERQRQDLIAARARHAQALARIGRSAANQSARTRGRGTR